MRISSPAVPALLLVLGLSACGGGTDGSSGAAAEGGGAGQAEEQRMEFYECLRENGLDVEDPETDPGSGDSGGSVGLPALPADDPNAEAALEECQDLMPDGGEAPEPDPEDVEAAREYAQCLRDNGVDMADPDPNGALAIPEDLDSEEFREASEECEDLMGGAPIRIQQDEG